MNVSAADKGLVQQSAGTLDLCSMQIKASAFKGESVSVTGFAGQRAYHAGQCGLQPAAVQRRKLHQCVHNGRGRIRGQSPATRVNVVKEKN